MDQLTKKRMELKLKETEIALDRLELRELELEHEKLRLADSKEATKKMIEGIKKDLAEMVAGG